MAHRKILCSSSARRKGTRVLIIIIMCVSPINRRSINITPNASKCPTTRVRRTCHGYRKRLLMRNTITSQRLAIGILIGI
jgi:hypothetical protein